MSFFRRTRSHSIYFHSLLADIFPFFSTIYSRCWGVAIARFFMWSHESACAISQYQSIRHWFLFGANLIFVQFHRFYFSRAPTSTSVKPINVEFMTTWRTIRRTHWQIANPFYRRYDFELTASSISFVYCSYMSRQARSARVSKLVIDTWRLHIWTAPDQSYIYSHRVEAYSA